MFKKSRPRGSAKAHGALQQFTYAMNFVKQTLEHEKNKDDKLLIIDYFLKVIKNDIKAEFLSVMFYEKDLREIREPFPTCITNNDGSILNFLSNEYKTICLATDTIFLLPWNNERMRNSIRHVYKNSFIYDKSNLTAYYYSYLDFCYISNGLHHTAAGMHFNVGTIEARIYHTENMFPFIYTDGVSWFNQETKSKLCDLFDFRMGVLFETSKIKYNLENGIV